MNRQEHLLTIAMEECAEVAQRLSKILRFGETEVQPDQRENPAKLDNRERLEREYSDLVSVMDMLGYCTTFDVREAKRHKVEEFLRYSQQQGTLT